MSAQVQYSLLSAILLAAFLLFAPETRSETELQMADIQIEGDTNEVNRLLKEARSTLYSDVLISQQATLQAHNLSVSINYPKGVALSKLYLAHAFISNDFKKTESYLLGALDIAKALADSSLLNSIQNGFGILYQNAGDHQKAIHYFETLLQHYLSNGNDSLTAAVYNNLAISHETLDNDSLAIHYYERAADINTKTGNFSWLARNHLNLGAFYLKMNDLSVAEQHLNKSLEMSRQLNDKSLQPLIYNNLYFVANARSMEAEAEKFARLTYQHAREQKDLFRERDALKALTVIKINNRETDSALLLQSRLISVLDTVFEKTRLEDMYANELRLKLEELHYSNESRINMMENEKTRKELVYLIIILVSILLLLLLGLLIRRQRSRLHRKIKEHNVIRDEKTVLEGQLEVQNKELTKHLLFLQKKNEYFIQLAAKLQQVAENSNDDTAYQLKNIINELGRNGQEDVWPEFEIRFKEVHSAFYQNLTRRFPNLTPNELKLCAFLKLNMSTKEISAITNQHPDTLKIARHRLRSKLGLSRSENMVNFLNQI